MTQWLLAILNDTTPSADMIGPSSSPRVPTSITKKLRDAVQWRGQTQSAWRRSVHWMAIKATAQLLLCRAHGQRDGRVFYKLLMLHQLAKLLQTASAASGAATGGHALSTDALMQLARKVARRMDKLDGRRYQRDGIPAYSTAVELVQQHALHAVQAAQGLMQQRWLRAQEVHAQKVQLCVPAEQWLADCRHSALVKAIKAALHSTRTPAGCGTVDPLFYLRSSQPQVLLPSWRWGPAAADTPGSTGARAAHRTDAYRTRSRSRVTSTARGSPR